MLHIKSSVILVYQRLQRSVTPVTPVTRTHLLLRTKRSHDRRTHLRSKRSPPSPTVGGDLEVDNNRLMYLRLFT